MAGPGVIQEQGFVAGSGLGFNPLSEQDSKKVQSGDMAGKNDDTDKGTERG